MVTIGAMRVGIDARLPAYRMGGISRYVIQLVNALSSLDGNTHYVVYQSRKETENRFAPASNVRRSTLGTPAHHRFERLLLSFELFPYKHDVFHSPDFIPPLRGGRRHVITVHDLNFLYYPQFLTRESRRYYAGQIDSAVSHADHIIADSEHTRQDLVSQLNVSPGKVTTVHLAADPLFRNAAATKEESAVRQTLDKYHLRPGFALFVGTIEPRKNIPTLLEAFDLARRELGDGCQLVLAGGIGWLHDDIFRKIDALDMGDVVRHIEAIDDEELAHLYLSAGLLALPSHYEGFGLPALEAMHCHCPVVASERAALPEIVGEAGILLPPTDEEAWASAIVNVLTNESLRQRLITLGIEQANRFSWARAAEATQEVYERVA